MDKIFIQIAAYRDRELIPSVEDALSRAKYPERISFGICWQYASQDELNYIKPLKPIENCRIKIIPASKSRGLGWARAQTEKLWRGERYTLQIDAHMRFADDWDTLLIEMLAMCPSEKPILTHYPPPYEPPRTLISTRCARLIGGAFTEVGTIVPKYDDNVNSDTPELGAFVAGGFMFADASILRQVPNDPQIYFNCTEVLYAARAWTSGWDIYYPHRPICWHYYNNAKGLRPLHWQEQQKSAELHQLSQQRFRQILQMEPATKNFGIYALGTTRTLAEYEQISGIDFRGWKKKTELELLLCCIRTQIDSVTFDRIQTLCQQQVDWNYLLQVATRYQVIPLLYATIDGHFRADVPTEIFSQLQADVYGNAKRNMLLTQELYSLLELLQTHQLRAIPVKGPILAALAYDNLLRRQFRDLDILVHPQDLQTATDLIIAHGYDLRKFDNQLNLFHPQRQIKLQLHQTITPDDCSLPLEFDSRSVSPLEKLRQRETSACAERLRQRVWSRLTAVTVAGSVMSSICATDTLLITIAQNAADFTNNRSRLVRLCDIAALIDTHQDLDWEYILTQARTDGHQRILSFTLLLVTDIFGTVLPAAIQQQIEADSTAKLLAKHARSNLFSPETNRLWGSLFYLKIRDRWWDRIKYLITPNSIDRLLIPLPSSLSYLYHPIRPLWLLYKYFSIQI
jgi:hypothetical protein